MTTAESINQTIDELLEMATKLERISQMVNEPTEKPYEPRGDCKRVLDYLREHGSITPLEALNGFGCLRLGARIYDLRAAGHDIRTHMIYTTDQHGEPCRYARYVLREEGEQHDDTRGTEEAGSDPVGAGGP